MIDRLPVTLAVQALLTSVTGMPVGLGRAPQSAPPYYLLYSIDTTVGGPPLDDMNGDLALIYQITSVSGPTPGSTQSYGIEEQAEWLADKARRALLERDLVTGVWLHPLTVPGAKNTARALETEPGGTNDPSDAIISYVQRFRLDLTAA
ncbi:hypothetical protein ACIPW9_36115 [Streptomyces sp. NPDC090052]|uniref:hypothetical protein n=1 Tax=Streptomyces sp. NPDC090052 TaxID=3365931 RepID=UPI00380602B5